MSKQRDEKLDVRSPSGRPQSDTSINISISMSNKQIEDYLAEDLASFSVRRQDGHARHVVAVVVDSPLKAPDRPLRRCDPVA